MSLMFGAILIVIGSAFVLGKITSPPSRGRIGLKEFGVAVVTSSPGLMLIVFGVILVAIPNISNQQIKIDDTSTYLEKNYERGNSQASDAHREQVVGDLLKKLTQGDEGGKRDED